jgi:hypothetical protein
MKAAVNLKRAQYNEVKFSCGQKDCRQKQCLILNGFAILILLNRTFVYSKTSGEKSIDFSLLLFIVITRRYNSSELLLTFN